MLIIKLVLKSKSGPELYVEAKNISTIFPQNYIGNTAQTQVHSLFNDSHISMGHQCATSDRRDIGRRTYGLTWYPRREGTRPLTSRLRAYTESWEFLTYIFLLIHPLLKEGTCKKLLGTNITHHCTCTWGSTRWSFPARSSRRQVGPLSECCHTRSRSLRPGGRARRSLGGWGRSWACAGVASGRRSSRASPRCGGLSIEGSPTR